LNHSAVPLWCGTPARKMPAKLCGAPQTLRRHNQFQFVVFSPLQALLVSFRVPSECDPLIYCVRRIVSKPYSRKWPQFLRESLLGLTTSSATTLCPISSTFRGSIILSSTLRMLRTLLDASPGALACIWLQNLI
jgi:hypothetical protein